MLTQVTLRNFRGFEDHELKLRRETVAVGRNNAGKSTVIEALRFIALVTQRAPRLSYSQPRREMDLPLRLTGASIDVTNLNIDFDTMFHVYSDPPAVIEAKFSNRCTITIYIGQHERLHAVLRDSDGNAVKSGAEAARLNIPRVSILPQITPLARSERVLNREYVLGSVDSPLASSHFRNQLKIFHSLFQKFKEVAENTWSGLQIRDLHWGRGFPNDSIILNIRNEEFVGEVARMGHGLQMWLQCIWFLIRADSAATIILDEPDVYMHADLQRRLVRYMRRLGKQMVIATHSVEVIAEFEPSDILVIERKRKRSRFADTIPAVQRIIEGVGSTHNIHLARLWSSKRFLLVEGKDLRILKRFHNKLFPQSLISLEGIPSMSIGGWGGWTRAIGSSMAMKNAFGETVQSYCILDRDYHSEEEIQMRLEEAASKKVHLHIWKRKEIENYLLVPSTIARVINSKPGAESVEEDLVTVTLLALAEALRDDAVDAISDELCQCDRTIRAGSANKRARAIVDERRSTDRGLIDVVSGKTLLSQISEWAQREFSCSITAVGLAGELTDIEMPNEVRNVVTAIEEATSFLH